MRLISYDGRGNQIAEQFPRGGTVTVAYDGHARLTRYRNGGASQTMLYNGMDERIQVLTTPAIGLADTRLYLYDLDHRIVGEYGATGTDLAPKAMPFIRKICSLLNGSFRRSSDRNQTSRNRPNTYNRPMAAVQLRLR